MPMHPLHDDWWKTIRKHLNFYRVHILFFTFTPLIFSVVFYASNGENHMSYIDSLFNCLSAMTVCGLATVDLSSLTPWQQVILFIQMCMGSPIVVSWFMVYIRRNSFAKKFQYIIDAATVKGTPPLEDKRPWYLRPFRTRKQDLGDDGGDDPGSVKKLRTDMIRRMDDAPQLVDPNGWISEARSGTTHEPVRHLFAKPRLLSIRTTSHAKLSRRLSDPGIFSKQSSLRGGPTHAPIQRSKTIAAERVTSRGVGFVPQKRPSREPRMFSDRDIVESPIQDQRAPRTRRASLPPPSHRTKHSGFGGFPMPHEVVGKALNRYFPRLERRLTRTITVPVKTTERVPYISFDTVVGRNSTFHYLTNDQIEELGGVEYRALNALLWIVAVYHVGLQVLGTIIIAPYMNMSRWQTNFEEPALHASLNPTWYSVFQAVSAYTNTGMSLVDQSMIPFQHAYPMIFVMIFLILAGNTSFPIFLRFTIWILTKIVPKNSRANETLHFLLDHPRRCFIYLFPSHQTWFLLTIVLSLTITDWFFFIVLDIGNPALEAIPIGTRLCIGLLQATAVRAAGFGTVSLSVLAPAVKVLYVVMMYVSVYPIAMSVRSTNVYEEQSLGVFLDDESDDESEFQPVGSRVTVWGKYLAMHARKQLAFDMWWLGLALFLVCIIERDNLEDVSLDWFDIFNLVFELVSAYGIVGLSLGSPSANYSFSGNLRTLSKLIICLVMLRGRHRGLPVAIDRAVMFPMEFKRDDGEREGGGHPGLVDEKSVNGDLRQRTNVRSVKEDEEVIEGFRPMHECKV